MFVHVLKDRNSYIFSVKEAKKTAAEVNSLRRVFLDISTLEMEVKYSTWKSVTILQ
jgi:hypothetical protein